MKTLTTLLLAALIVGFGSSNVFANKTNWGINASHYKYALVKGEVTSIDLERKVITVDGVNSNLIFDKHTTFYTGAISLPMEKVFSPVSFTEKQKIKASDISVGDVVKSRYEVMENGLIILDTCLVGAGVELNDTKINVLVAEN